MSEFSASTGVLLVLLAEVVVVVLDEARVDVFSIGGDATIDCGLAVLGLSLAGVPQLAQKVFPAIVT